MSLGRIVKYIRPDVDNPRNSEGAFHTFRDGKIIFVYSRYKGNSHGDGASCDLYKLISYDGGETFVDGGAVFTCEELDAQNIMSVSLIELKNGNVGLFFIKKFTDHQDTILMSESSDGEEWSSPRCVLSDEGFFVLNNDRVIRLKDGRIVMPYAYHWSHPVLKKEGTAIVREPGIVYIYGSDDEKNFYRLSKGYTINNSRAGCQEPLLIQHKDGRVECYIRTDLGYQLKMTAKDESLAEWSEPEKTDFVSQEAPMAMKYIDDDTLLAIWTSKPEGADPKVYAERFNMPSQGRCYFVYAVSRDGGVSFSSPRVLEHDESRGFCYTAIHTVGDSVLLAYCSGGGNDEKCCLNRITIRKVKKDEFV